MCVHFWIKSYVWNTFLVLSCLEIFLKIIREMCVGSPAWLPGWSSPPLHLHPPGKSSITFTFLTFTFMFIFYIKHFTILHFTFMFSFPSAWKVINYRLGNSDVIPSNSLPRFFLLLNISKCNMRVMFLQHAAFMIQRHAASWFGRLKHQDMTA